MKLVVNFLKGSAIDKLTDFFPIIAILLLFVYDHFIFLDDEGSLEHFLSIFLKPSPVQFDAIFIAGDDGNFHEVYLLRVGREREEIDFFFSASSFLVLAEFIHELAVFFICAFDGLLLLDDSRLFFEGIGSVSVELEVADDAARRRVLFSEPVSADEVFEVVDAVHDVVSDF